MARTRSSKPLQALLRELRVLSARKSGKKIRIRKTSDGKGLTARQLLSYTPRRIKENAEYVRVRKVKRKKGENFSLAVTTTERSHATEKQPHYQSIEILSPKGERNIFDRHTRVKLSCDCSNFLYTWEYALFKKGAADIIYSNGEPPDTTNPKRIPGICLAGNTLINTSRGLIKIKDIHAGDLVEAASGKYRRVQSSGKTGIRKTLKISLSRGRYIEATKNHLIQVWDLNSKSLIWKKAQKIQLKDLIISRHPKQVQGQQKIKIISDNKTFILNEDIATLIGYMIAEGSRGFFANQNKLIKKDFINRFKRVFPEAIYQKRGSGVAIIQPSYKFFSDCGVIWGSYNKEIPEIIMKSTKEIKIAFLRGAYAGDGCFSNSLSTYATVSEKLAYQMSNLLWQFGINSSTKQYLSGIKPSVIWTIRTTNYHQTKKLYKLLQPIRGWNKKPSLTKEADSANSIITSKELRNLAKDHIKEIVGLQANLLNDKKIYRVHKEAKILFPKGVKGIEGLFKFLKRQKFGFTMKLLNIDRPVFHATAWEIGQSPRYKDSWIRYFYKQINKVKPHKYKSRISRASKKYIHKWFEDIDNTIPGFKDKNKDLYTILDDNYVLDKVVSIEYSSARQPVYDLSVAREHNFIANGMIVHNCKHWVAIFHFLRTRSKT